MPWGPFPYPKGAGPGAHHPKMRRSDTCGKTLAFSKLDQAFLAGAGFETGATERALKRVSMLVRLFLVFPTVFVFSRMM